MKEDLLALVGQIDARFIEEAADCMPRHRRRVPAWAAAAAALLICAVPAGLLLHARRAAAPQPPVLEQAKAEREAALPYDRSDGERDAAQALAALSIGALRLGQTAEAAEAALGAPDAMSNSGPVKYADGVTRVCWFYYGQDDDPFALRLEFADNGEGWALNEIWAREEPAGGLPLGIRLGDDRQRVRQALCADEAFASCLQETDASLCLRAGHLSLSVWFSETGEAESVILGPLFPPPPFEDVPPEPEPGPFASAQITVWRRSEGVWRSMELTDRAAKYVEVQFGIEDLQPWSYDGDAPDWVVDFHNGTVVCFYGSADTGAVCTLEDRNALVRSLSDGEDPAGLAPEQYAVFPEGSCAALAEAFGGYGE